ncbi:MAG: nucleotide sugar dehydrogenase, partial [Anaerolineae bacterium]|nr:nucleotide sugar dehydrogenase [Anaerolineae bacterium]
CEAVGGDVWRVRELVNKSPGRNMLFPGAGVGGHCIPKDPWLLTHQAREKGVAVRLIPAARAVNEAMPLHMIALLSEALAEAGKILAHARILVLGSAYLENSDDTRNSPSAVLAAHLQARGARVVIHDPYVPGYQGDVYALGAGCDGVVVMVKHNLYRDLDWARLGIPVVVDGRRVVSDDFHSHEEIRVRLVGRAG